jgi:response regulator RpfG family c-di-GMP phosphodiesterase
METKGRLRAAGHYGFAVVILSLYGGEVCPFIDTLPLHQWTILNSCVFGGLFFIRSRLIPRAVDRAPLETQCRNLFILEILLFLVGGKIVMLFNKAFFEFPLLISGAKMIVGSLALGFFAASDLALERERLIFRELQRTGAELPVKDRYFPLTGKFALTALSTLVFVSMIAFLVVYRDLWALSFESEMNALGLKNVILVEVAFIGIVFLLEIGNLILSFSKNLRLALHNENSTLTSVAEGNLDSRVTVGTNDEFGVMGKYTNLMIGRLKARTEEIQLTQDVTIMTLASLAETRDNETGAHILRTQRYVRILAEVLQVKPKFKDRLDDRTVDLLFKSAALHDIGKVGVRDAVLLKPGKLTPEEFEEMKKHPVYGMESLRSAERILGDNSFMRLAKEIAYTHHEKWDGTGYPRGLKGEDIPLSGRLMALGDVYDALISKRVYKEGFSHEIARGIILEGTGKHFDPDIVEAFLEVEQVFIRIAAEFADGKQIPAVA